MSCRKYGIGPIIGVYKLVKGLRAQLLVSITQKVAQGGIEIGEMEKHLGHLGLIAGIAPTLGFIGTISGVIKIFYNISLSDNISIGIIAGGLYEKMISSGSGLVVGILAFTAYHLLNGIIDNYALGIQKLNLDFIKLMNSKIHPF